MANEKKEGGKKQKRMRNGKEKRNRMYISTTRIWLLIQRRWSCLKYNFLFITYHFTHQMWFICVLWASYRIQPIGEALWLHPIGCHECAEDDWLHQRCVCELKIKSYVKMMTRWGCFLKRPAGNTAIDYEYYNFALMWCEIFKIRSWNHKERANCQITA